MKTLFVALSRSPKTEEEFLEHVSFDREECLDHCADSEIHNPGYEYYIEEYRTELEGSAQEVFNAIRDEDIQPDACNDAELITSAIREDIVQTLLKCNEESLRFNRSEWNVWFDINNRKAIYDEGDTLYYRSGLIFLHSFNAQYQDAIDFAYDSEEEILEHLNADELAQLNDAKQNDPFFNGNVNYVKENFLDKFLEYKDEVIECLCDEYTYEYVGDDVNDCLANLEKHGWVYAC